ncbi:MAG: PrsW family glutamic-type intramembrane protease [Verrucomicrobiota bacterium]
MEIYVTRGPERLGPFTVEQARAKLAAGELSADDLAWHAGAGDWQPLSALLAAAPNPAPPPLSSPPPATPGAPIADLGRKLVSDVGSLSDKVIADLRDLHPQLLMPFGEFKSLRWLDNKKLLAVVAVGLWPLVCLTFFGSLKSAYWALALYFSVLWGMFFFYLFPSPEVTRRSCVLCFFGTGLISIAILFSLHGLWPLSQLLRLAFSEELPSRLVGMFLGVAIPEEFCKAIVIFLFAHLSPVRLRPQTLLFYGLMSGLGFGIYEGVSYQLERNPAMARGIGEYYLLNMIRLTSLPFLHAMWSGIAGYFIGFAALHPKRKHGLYVAAIGIPAILHASHNAFAVSQIAVSLFVDFMSVVALIIYLSNTTELEKKLEGGR